MNNFQLTKNFNLQEFECTHPGHRHVRVDEKLVEKLQELRNILSRPIFITSAFRCKKRNNMVGGAKVSQHLYGQAADIMLSNQEKDIEQIAEIAKDIGFSGIGFYKTFIHLDVRELSDGNGKIVTWGGIKND